MHVKLKKKKSLEWNKKKKIGLALCSEITEENNNTKIIYKY